MIKESNYEILKDVLTAVNRLEDKMDGRLNAVERDIDDLKSFKSRIIGITMVFGTISGFIADWLWKRVTHPS